MFRHKAFLASLRMTAILVLVLASSPARATMFSSTELGYDNAMLSQFNLITLGNLNQTTATTIGGRTIVGGTASFSTVAGGTCMGCGGSTAAIDRSGSSFGALTVFGNLVGATNTSSGGLGSPVTGSQLGGSNTVTSVRGAVSGNVDLNGGTLNVAGSAAGAKVVDAGSIRTSQSSFAGSSYTTKSLLGLPYSAAGPSAQVNQGIASVFPFATDYQATAKTLSTGLAALPGSPSVKAQALTSGDGIFFTANNDFTNAGKKYGVVTTTLANLASQTNFKGIDNGTNDATIVIVTGDGANYTLPNLNSYVGSSKIIFDFVDATTLRFGGNWSGSILAPLAAVTAMGGTIDGSVIVNSINQTQALYATNLFTGDLSGLVPEPSSIALLGAGLVAAGLLGRRRK